MLKFEHLSFSYDKPIFEDVNLSFPVTSLFCIYGKSGSGKTTLLRLLTFEIPFKKGKMIYNDQEISASNVDDFLFNHVCYIDQEGQYFKNMTLYQHFEFYANLHSIEMNKEIAQKYLKKLRLEDIELKMNPARLSTGERKRFLIALSLMMKKNIMIFDEPTASLDTKNKSILIDLLKEFSQTMLIICTTHDQQLKERADYLCEIKDYQLLLDKKIKSQNTNFNEMDKKPHNVHYFKYKNRKQKFFFMILLFVGIISTLFISKTISENISLNSQISKHSMSMNHRGLIYYKLPDARFLDLESYDFIEQQDLDIIKNINGVQSVTPYYALYDYADGRNRTFSFTSQGETREISYLWPKQSDKFGIDFYIHIVIYSYDPLQHIQQNGEDITGMYINEDFADLIGKEASQGGKLKLDFQLPTQYFEATTTIEGVNGDVREYRDKREEFPLSLSIDGVLHSDIYSDSNISTEGNYVKIYMPVDKVQKLLKNHAQSQQHIYKQPMTYLLMCDEDKKENIKIEIEKTNELYRARYQDIHHSVNTVDSTNSSYLIPIFVCFVLILINLLLSYYQLYLRKNELNILRREGLIKQIDKYYMKDYYLIGIFCICISIIGLWTYYIISGAIFELWNFTFLWIGTTLLFVLLVMIFTKISLYFFKKRICYYD